ncbi:hypothetical protein COCCADRAFT_82395 [Bipolaris zeicola 26-R-13]|uniref:Uncharacterized protein n=1 Tax=Cochliobolus carbonum (strain 26-R-13) TaxID=930089 RepID=W6YLL3_COCC2|nr:uncharacterized protein COCCADRAFT_82395 [Bipolaris zeicola 26-R-13]EUC38640.1 hypothetical protein COCCADRAFT_82395 [Bipolaris zeicola 26-R-13]
MRLSAAVYILPGVTASDGVMLLAYLPITRREPVVYTGELVQKVPIRSQLGATVGMVLGSGKSRNPRGDPRRKGKLKSMQPHGAS